MATTRKSAAATACAPSKAQLLRFVKTRNESGFSSNLQFSTDAGECGFDVQDLGQAFKLEAGGYRWWTPHGQLIEHPDGTMELIEGAGQAAQVRHSHTGNWLLLKKPTGTGEAIEWVVREKATRFRSEAEAHRLVTEAQPDFPFGDCKVYAATGQQLG